MKLEPLRINSTQPSLARSFVEAQQQDVQWEQQELQRKLGLPKLRPSWLQRRVAFQKTEAKMQDALKAAGCVCWGLLCRAGPAENACRVRCACRGRLLTGTCYLLPRLARRETSAGGYLEYIQQQEEEALQAALKKLQDQQAAGS